MDFGVKLHNRFDAELIDGVTGEIKQIAKAENVVCDTYWNHLFNRRESIYYIHVGTGTGTPSRTDTRLFKFLASKGISLQLSSLDKNNWKATQTVTLSENEWVGALTEVGLSPDSTNYSDDYIVTHALFTDSEGNPITITKTNADRLSITATLYLTLTWTSPNNNVYFSPWARSATNMQQNADTRVDYVQGDGYYTSIIQWLLHLTNGIGGRILILPTSLPTRWNYYFPVTTHGWITANDTYTLDTSTVRLKMDTRVLSDSYNSVAPTTYLIKCLAHNTTEAFVTLPNEAVYPAKQLTLEQIADGTTTDFNFGIPELKTTNVEVYVNDVLQNTNTYTFYGRDYTHPQGWKSYDNLYITKITGYTSEQYSSTDYHRPSPICIWYEYLPQNYSTTSTFAEFFYDFKTNYTVSAVGVYKGTQNWRTYVAAPELYYSSDGESWTQVTNLWTDYRNQSNIDSTNGIVNISPISARYWKVKNYHNILDRYAEYFSQYTAGSFQLVASILFDDPKPQLHFDTAPPANATVKIKAYCEYPVKNENWIIENGMTFDYTFTRL